MGVTCIFSAKSKYTEIVLLFVRIMEMTSNHSNVFNKRRIEGVVGMVFQRSGHNYILEK